MPEPTWKIDHGPRDDMPWWEDHARLKLFGSIFVIFSICGVIWYAYFSDNNPKRVRDNGALIVAEEGVTRVRPENPGGYDVPHRDKTVYDKLGAEKLVAPARTEKIVDAPEEPVDVPVETVEKKKPSSRMDIGVPQRIKPLVEPDSLNDSSAIPPRPSLHSKAQDTDQVIIEGGAVHTRDDEKPKTPGIPKTLPPQSGVRDPYAQPATPAPKKVEKPARVLDASKKEMAEPKASVQPVVKKPGAPAKYTRTPPAAPVVKGGYRVQLASLKTEPLAQQEWERAHKKYGALKGLPHSIVKADLGAKGIYYRVQAGSFKSKKEADAMCSALKSERAACIVVKG